MSKTITREQFIEEIDRRQPDERPVGWPWGNVHKWDRAMSLLRTLKEGGQPNARQVAGYFGAGATFEDGE